MPPSNAAGREVLTELIERFPNAPALTIAKRAYKDHPELWTKLENARSMVRVMFGASGKRHRSKRYATHKRTPRSPGVVFPGLPESIEGLDGWKAVHIDTPGPWGVISDIHIPFHNLPALRVTLQEGKRRGWKGILINGDLFDFPQFSRFDKDPRNKDFPRDLYRGRQFLDCLKSEFPKARKVFKFGNHDQHYSRYLWTKAPELLDVESAWLENLIECDQYGVEVVKDNQPVKLGKLWVVHGHEWGRSSTSPVSPARTMFNRGHDCVMCGHWHKSTSYSEPTIAEHQITCWSTGCLCGLHPEWARLNGWGHGAATVEVYKDGAFEVDNFRILHGRKWS